MPLLPCAWNLNCRSNGEFTDFVGELKIRSGRGGIARVATGILVASEAGGNARSSGEMSTVPALAAWPFKASKKTHKPKATNRMTDPPIGRRSSDDDIDQLPPDK